MILAPRIAILGAGPIGLEAALAAAERGWPFDVYEAAPRVAGHVRRWGHVRVFTPWDQDVSPRMRDVLGPDAPGGGDLPTGDELAERLYEPVARRLGGRVHTGVRVEGVSRQGLLKSDEIGTGRREERPFRILLTWTGGEERLAEADVVIDATGTYGSPNALGDGGIPAPGERALGDRVERAIPDLAADPRAWAGRTILLTGSGHSAQTAARDLAAFARDAPGTRVVWAVRSAEPDFGAVTGDPLRERARLNRAAAELAAGASAAVDFRPGRVTEAVSAGPDGVWVSLRNGTAEDVTVDRVLSLTGSVGDFTLYRQLQVHECYATAGPMNLAAALLASGGGSRDCLAVEPPGPDALRNPEPGFFLAGAKSYGRNSQFLLRHGWQQIDDVFGLL